VWWDRVPVWVDWYQWNALCCASRGNWTLAGYESKLALCPISGGDVNCFSLVEQCLVECGYGTYFHSVSRQHRSSGSCLFDSYIIAYLAWRDTLVQCLGGLQDRAKRPQYTGWLLERYRAQSHPRSQGLADALSEFQATPIIADQDWD